MEKIAMKYTKQMQGNMKGLYIIIAGNHSNWLCKILESFAGLFRESTGL